MARRHTLIQNFKSIAGAALIGLGVFILSRNLVEAAALLSDHLGITGEEGETLGVVATFGLAASQLLQSYLFDRQEFLQGLYQILMSFSPLLLVIAGRELMRDGCTDEAKELPNGNTGRVDLAAPRSTLK